VKEGARKPDDDELDLSIPNEFNIQGAKVTKLTQAAAYDGIKQWKPTQPRHAAEDALQRTQDAIRIYTGETETYETIWKSIRKPAIRHKIRQFLYKTIHSTYMIGQFWSHIPGAEDRQFCTTCGRTESMEHILTQCNAPPRRLIWSLAEQAWPNGTYEWPQISSGIILGCGAITTPKQTHQNAHQDKERRRPSHRATCRLLQILLSESAHLIWVLRCERVIYEKSPHQQKKYEDRWYHAINDRLTIDKFTATMIKQNKTYTKLIKDTWEPLLYKENDLPTNWISNHEVLVGRRPSQMF
jgi:hypothetical protein